MSAVSSGGGSTRWTWVWISGGEDGAQPCNGGIVASIKHAARPSGNRNGNDFLLPLDHGFRDDGLGSLIGERGFRRGVMLGIQPRECLGVLSVHVIDRGRNRRRLTRAPTPAFDLPAADEPADEQRGAKG